MALQPGQSPPFAVITPTDQRGAIYVNSGMALATAAVCLVVRAYVRLGSGQMVGRDDYAIMGAFVFMIAQTIAVCSAAVNGLGEASDLVLGHAESVAMQRGILAADILFILAMWLSRCSSVFFFERLFFSTTHEVIWKIMVGITAMLGIVSVWVVALRCNLSHAWLFVDQHCAGLFDRWLAVSVLAIAFEVALFLQPAYMIARLQMENKLKAKVIAAFSGRLLIIIPTVLHLIAIRAFYRLTEGQPISSYDSAAPYIYTQIMLALSVVAPTIPLLQPFVQATATTFGMVSGLATNSYGEGTSGNSGRDRASRGISKTTSIQHAVSARRISMQNPHGDVQYTASAFHGRRASGHSDISQQPMIRRDLQYDENGPT